MNNPMNESYGMDVVTPSGKKSWLEKQIDFQESVRPKMSDHYYGAVRDYMTNLEVVEMFADYKNYDAFPEEFRKYEKTVPSNRIFGNGALKLSAYKIESPGEELTSPEEFFDTLQKLSQDLHDKFGLTVSYEPLKDKNGKILEYYFVCFPGKIVKDEKNDWVPKENPGDAAKFFAVLVKNGLTDEESVINEMGSLGLQGVEFKKKFLEALEELNQPKV